ncbi:MAG TPA: C-GCAxxG-C-C family protein [Thermoanaerobaculaceae bacterium]|nr:C-GCAxxG-C-C family protein [Thermoanaerobaculaceae bacterium]HPS77864.1 C-GCAxxG-C-C family protein [Thermoanaerobaculaceae bacterium]
MNPGTDRRSFVTALGGFGIAGASGLLGLAGTAGAAPQGGQIPKESQSPLEALGRVPWPYKPLDAEAMAQQASVVYQRGGCMLAVFDPLVRTVAERLGSPYTAFPFAMFAYGAGGVAGWGTLCGALNGAAAAFSLLSGQPGAVISALLSWYEREALPDFLPTGARFPTVASVAGSLLCHTSVTHWCKASGRRSASPERAERCAALSGSVARKAAALLNAQAAGALIVPSPEEATLHCLSCHGAQGSLGNTAGRMSCAPCHSTAQTTAHGHPKT